MESKAVIYTSVKGVLQMPDESKNSSQQNLRVSKLSLTALGFVFVLMIIYIVSMLLGYIPLVFGGFIIMAIFIIFILSLIDLLKKDRNKKISFGTFVFSLVLILLFLSSFIRGA